MRFMAWNDHVLSAVLNSVITVTSDRFSLLILRRRSKEMLQVEGNVSLANKSLIFLSRVINIKHKI